MHLLFKNLMKLNVVRNTDDIITYFSAYSCNPYRSNGGNSRLEIIIGCEDIL